MNRSENLLLERYPALEGCMADFEAAYALAQAAYSRKNKLLLCGNGGSAADCGHIVGELMKGFRSKRTPTAAVQAPLNAAAEAAGLNPAFAEKLQGALPAISLCAHSELFTAFANDVDADLAFAQQVYGYGVAGDVLLGLSTSGNSRNVCYAMLVAKQLGMKTIAFTGRDGGKLRQLSDVCVRVPAEITAEVQEYHLPLYHCLCAMLEDAFFPDGAL